MQTGIYAPATDMMTETAAVARMPYCELTQLVDLLAATERRLRQARAALVEMCPQPEDMARAGRVDVPGVILGALAAMDADLLTTVACVERTVRRHRHAAG